MKRIFSIVMVSLFMVLSVISAYAVPIRNPYVEAGNAFAANGTTTKLPANFNRDNLKPESLAEGFDIATPSGLETMTLTTIPENAGHIENPGLELRGATFIDGFDQIPIWNEATTGMPAYCLDLNRDYPSPGALIGLLDPVTTYDHDTYEGLKALLLAGYPFNTGGLSNDRAQAYTQMAIWCWTYERRLGYGLDVNLYLPLIPYGNQYNFFMSLINAARKQTSPVKLTSTDVFMEKNGNILTGQTTVTFNNLQGGYFIDENMLPEGITVSGDNGRDGDMLTFTAPLSFAGQTITLDNILLGYDERSPINLFWYENKNPSEQRMVMPVLGHMAVAISAGITLNFADAGSIKLMKLADGTNKPLAGAVFGVFIDTTDEKVGEIITDENGEAVLVLPAGDYYLVELIAPEGYTLDIAENHFSITINGITEITLTNTPESGGPTEPPGPTEPTEPTVPPEPTVSPAPTEPTEPTVSPTPTEPTEPTVSPTPTVPSAPSESTEPAKPSEPPESTVPTELAKPSEPAESTAPTEPTALPEPTESIGPTEPADSSEPAESTEPAEPTELITNPKPAVPTHTLTPGEYGIYIEFDENGVPLGQWVADEDGVWTFEEYPLPKINPQTGEDDILSLRILVSCTSLVTAGLLFWIDHRRKRV